ncbi:S16 family serine protease [Roseimicrobium sp. ORNL1]|uniref:S16 family serine protease n=1 Tax=Roseimicrobium sp. ORNL1 TaxID=2711231 RepID=UPI0013E179F7|nr:S16 family serine protease [Roseimicrobium sp. ORNL1]QIF02108.1 hypothetical protein G5S37_11375 [Roseimicrobium sp. ORNL1]
MQDASAQSRGPYYITKDTTVPFGNYVANSLVQVCGGTLYEKNQTVRLGQPIDLSLAEGSKFENIIFDLSNCHLRAKGVYFKGGRISLWQKEAKVSFEDCKFEQVTFVMGSAHHSDDDFERHRSHLWFKNSVLNRVTFETSRKSEAATSLKIVVGLKMEQCTVLGPSRLVSFPPVTPTFLADMKKAETEITSCAFVQSTYTLPFLALTKECLFDSCVLETADNLEALTAPVTVPVTFQQPESAEAIKSNYPQLILTPASGKVLPGCQLVYTLTNGEISTNDLPTSVVPVTNLATVVPPAVPIPGAPPVPGMPPVANQPQPQPRVRPQRQAEAPPTLVSATATGTNGAPDSGLKIPRVSLDNLQLKPRLGGGSEGSLAKLEAAAVQGAPGSSGSVRCDVPVTTAMGKALQEVAKFIQLNHGGWPQGQEITLFFTGRYSYKDGPSPAVASALLLHSMISGKELDPAFAVAGDMNADGSVQPIGGVAERIRGAAKSNCKLAGIPATSVSELGDLLLTDGPAPFATVQIFGLEHFREAEALALTTKPEALTAAITEMNRVQEVLLRNPAQMGGMLRNQHVIAKLQQVLKDAPNHLSARYLLLYASGKLPQTISLGGSLHAIDEAGKVLLDTINANGGGALPNINKDSVGSSLTRLQAVRARCDARTRPYADALLRLGTAMKEVFDRPSKTVSQVEEYKAKIRNASDAVDAELSRLLNDPAVREAMNE